MTQNFEYAIEKYHIRNNNQVIRQFGSWYKKHKGYNSKKVMCLIIPDNVLIY